MSKPKNKKRREVQDQQHTTNDDDGPVIESDKKNEEVITNVKVELRDENPDKVDPVIGYFPSGYDPNCGRGGETEANATFYKHTKRLTRMKLVVSPNAESSRLNFVGTSFSGEAMAPQMCTYRLGILDKSTQTLKIVPIAANKIFRLEPRVEGFDQPEDEIDNEKREETAEERDAMKDKLTQVYSTKKSIREAKKLERLRGKQDPNTKDVLEKQLEGVKINESALKDPDTNKDARNIPPYDLEAMTPETAYPLNKIIFEGEWDYLLDVLELSNTGAEVSGDVYPTFVCNRVYKLGDIKDEIEKRKLAGIFSYITHLIKFKDRHSIDGVQSAKKHRFPGILFQRFSSLFTPSESHRIPGDKMDLLINYILVLTLYADDFKTDFSDIKKDLRMSAGELRNYFDYLGCKIVREKQMTLATLPLPLHFPDVNRKRQRRK